MPVDTLVATPDPEPERAPTMPQLTWGGYLRVTAGEALAAAPTTTTVFGTWPSATTTVWTLPHH